MNQKTLMLHVELPYDTDSETGYCITPVTNLCVSGPENCIDDLCNAVKSGNKDSMSIEDVLSTMNLIMNLIANNSNVTCYIMSHNYFYRDNCASCCNYDCDHCSYSDPEESFFKIDFEGVHGLQDLSEELEENGLQFAAIKDFTNYHEKVTKFIDLLDRYEEYASIQYHLSEEDRNSHVIIVLNDLLNESPNYKCPEYTDEYIWNECSDSLNYAYLERNIKYRINEQYNPDTLEEHDYP